MPSPVIEPRISEWKEHTFSPKPTQAELSEWPGYGKFLFRVAFLFFVVLAIPTSAKWYAFIGVYDK